MKNRSSVCLLNQSGIKTSQIIYICRNESSAPPQSLNNAEMLVFKWMPLYMKDGSRSEPCQYDIVETYACVCDSKQETGESEGDDTELPSLNSARCIWDQPHLTIAPPDLSLSLIVWARTQDTQQLWPFYWE